MLPICILAIQDDEDRACMARLFVRFQRLMYRCIFDILDDTWATEDALQTTLLRLMEHVDTIRRMDDAQLANYVAAACRHVAYNLRRTRIRHPETPLDEMQRGETEDPEEQALHRLELDALARIWPQLDSDTRWLLEGRYVLGYSDQELAQELSVKPASVRMALTRARKRARKLLQSELDGNS